MKLLEHYMVFDETIFPFLMGTVIRNNQDFGLHRILPIHYIYRNVQCCTLS